ncbi:hypothetical protein L596_006892 [Steinernema carpocapsae]|uniref:Uncharacterized protein n=1 Tax=Steinernema carpocapsae TaxID=34508 RepID=A0A4U5P8B5_STECR|nr:hypothetical protein L596_006892 [Steinernema carpocapsae]
MCELSNHFLSLRDHAHDSDKFRCGRSKKALARRSGVISSSFARNNRSVPLTNNVKPTGRSSAPRTPGMGLFRLASAQRATAYLRSCQPAHCFL